jgi:hypothetical protein
MDEEEQNSQSQLQEEDKSPEIPYVTGLEPKMLERILGLLRKLSAYDQERITIKII